jgi:hypothetical protein
MEDLKRVQEFFSKPLSEKLNLSNPEITDSGLQMHLINLNKELSYYLEKGEASDLRYAEMLKKDIADARAELDKRIKSKKGTNEAQQEDPTDIIAMDVPLFIRMLEYAREDAETDMDLHNVAERAIEAVKLRGLLSMDDYNDLIGGQIEEEIDYLSLKDDNPFDDVPSIDIQLIDDKEGITSPTAFITISAMGHDGSNGKMQILKDNPALQDKVLKTLQSEFQKTFRRVIHGILGKPFGLDEEEGYSKYLATPENPQGKTPGLTPDIMSKILMKIANIKDDDVEETTRLGEGVIHEELCPKGKAYIKKRMAAGEKSSAYLSGRAVKVCKGQMKG